jgi:hypothetical protein
MKLKPSALLIAMMLVFTCQLNANETIGNDEDFYIPIDTNGDGINDALLMPPFEVDGNDPDTFDWEGYWAWYESEFGDPWWEAPDPFDDSGGGATAGGGTSTGNGNSGNGNLGTYPSNGTYPYAQTTDAACAPNTARNILAMFLNETTTEAEVAQRMARGLGENTTARFEEGGNGLENKIKQAFTAALNEDPANPVLEVKTPPIYQSEEAFRTMMLEGIENNGAFIVLTNLTTDGNGNGILTGIPPPGQGTGFNHVVLFEPMLVDDTGEVLMIKVVDSGRVVDGNATVEYCTPEDAMAIAWGNGNIYPVVYR